MKYEEQLERTRRYYIRFQKLNNGMEHSAPSEEYIDDVYAFFQNCYHLKDWLKNDPEYIKQTNQQIEDHVSNTQALSICADICNGSKHLTFNRNPRSGHQPRFGKKVIKVEINSSFSGKKSQVKIGMRLCIEHAGKTLDAFELATEALQSWKSFII